VCADYVEYFICRKASREARVGSFLQRKENEGGNHPGKRFPGEGGKGSLGKPTSSRLVDKVGRMGGAKHPGEGGELQLQLEKDQRSLPV